MTATEMSAEHSVSLLDHDLNQYFPDLLKFNSIEETQRSAVYQKIRPEVERILSAVVCENFSDTPDSRLPTPDSTLTLNLKL
jgi:hypothetical protein